MWPISGRGGLILMRFAKIASVQDTTQNKNPSQNFFREGLCASDGNRTRTGIAAHGIFLLLLLLHKPASSLMLSRCSLDYFLTMRQLLRLGPPCIVSTPFISNAEFSEPSPKPVFLQARFPFVRGVLLSEFPLRHSVRQFCVAA